MFYIIQYVSFRREGGDKGPISQGEESLLVTINNLRIGRSFLNKPISSFIHKKKMGLPSYHVRKKT